MKNLVFLLGPTIFAAAIFTSGFLVGQKSSRDEIRQLANSMSSEPVNSFSVCLTKMWEESGELDGKWKGQRRWILSEKGEK